MSRRAIRKTDFGTVLLHWTLVALLLVAVSTGLRIAIDSTSELHWLRHFDTILPQNIVWTAHIPVGTALFAVALSYAVYVVDAGLFRRIRPDVSRIKGLVGSRQARHGALNVILLWVLFLALATELVTGTMLYIGYGGMATQAHLFATWVILGYVPCHVIIHYLIGGKSQLLRIFNPTRLPPPPQPFDPYEMIAARVYPAGQSASQAQSPDEAKLVRGAKTVRPEAIERGGKSQARGNTTIHAHPLPSAIAGGLSFLLFLLSLDTVARETLTISQIATNERPTIDGDVSDPVWRKAEPITIPTAQGANLDGLNSSVVEIRAVHDGTNAYFSFIWNDPTRSLKHVPLIKAENGWQVLQEGFDRDDATGFFEDKFAVLLVSKYALIPGDRTFHAGARPLDDKPATFSGRGLHYSVDGGYSDMWQWHASSGGMLGWVDDAHLGPPANPSQAQAAGREAYKGGFSGDPGNAFFSYNFDVRGPGGYQEPVIPKRLPREWRKIQAAMGTVDPNPNHGDAEDSAWWMTEGDSVPYNAELDARIPVGAMIPGVVISGKYFGDRADVRGAAKWASGRWSLEVSRKLDTGSKFDTPIITGSYMRVAVFDHTQSRHTRHIRPIRLEVHRCGKVAECMSTTKDSPPIGAKSF
jgi:cytochrome b subunit of formate dehydrogenase